MTEAINKRIDDLTAVVKDMNDNHIQERRENARLMEKLVDSQARLSSQFAEKSAYDKATAEQLTALWKKVEEQGKTLIELRVETSANSEARLNSVKMRNTFFGIIASILITGAIIAWAGSKT